MEATELMKGNKKFSLRHYLKKGLKGLTLPEV
jgi:hypothetical protein